MWHALRRDGIAIGHEQTAKLMQQVGLTGKTKGKSPVTTRNKLCIWRAADRAVRLPK